MAKANLTNAQLADLLAQQGRQNAGTLARAYRRAARSAFLWPDAVAELVADRESLLHLHGVGPFIARKLTEWVNDPPTRRPQVPPERRDFLTTADARSLLAK